MKINILFTKSNLPGSVLIRRVVKEPVSHVALERGGVVLHSTFSGVRMEPLEVFNKNNVIEYSLEYETEVKMKDLFIKYYDKKYDFLGLVSLGARALWPFMIRKQDVRGVSGAYLCTELVTDALVDVEELITPYKLYLRLKDGV